MPLKTVILGGGAMATACALLLAEQAEHEVVLWARNPQYAEEMQQLRENRRLLPGITIPAGVAITSDIATAARNADFYVVSIPSKHLRASLEQIGSFLERGVPVVSVVKGIEVDTLLRPSQIIAELLGPRPVIALSGPSHAEEIARRLPASVVAAAPQRDLAKQVQAMFTTDRFRVYTNTDLVGTELAGALKNVIGIAAGISDGLGYGDNAKAAMMTRGIVEMSRFGEVMGADPTTFSGLAGIGDLITTCVSPHGRNRAVGERLGRGETLNDILSSMQAIAEGVTTTKAVRGIAQLKRIDMPLVEAVYDVLFNQISPLEVTNKLMTRPLKSE